MKLMGNSCFVVRILDHLCCFCGNGPLQAHLLHIQIRLMQIVHMITSIVLPVVLSAPYVSYSKILRILFPKENAKANHSIFNSICIFHL